MLIRKKPDHEHVLTDPKLEDRQNVFCEELCFSTERHLIFRHEVVRQVDGANIVVIGNEQPIGWLVLKPSGLTISRVQPDNRCPTLHSDVPIGDAIVVIAAPSL